MLQHECITCCVVLCRHFVASALHRLSRLSFQQFLRSVNSQSPDGSQYVPEVFWPLLGQEQPTMKQVGPLCASRPATIWVRGGPLGQSSCCYSCSQTAHSWVPWCCCECCSVHWLYARPCVSIGLGCMCLFDQGNLGLPCTQGWQHVTFALLVLVQEPNTCNKVSRNMFANPCATVIIDVLLHAARDACLASQHWHSVGT